MGRGRQAGTGLLGTVRATLVLLVSLSSGLTAAHAGASLQVVAGAAVLGLVFGILVVTVALPGSSDSRERDPRLEWED